MLDQSSVKCVATCHTCITACEHWLALRSPARRTRNTEQGEDLCLASIRLCRLVIEELKLRSAFSKQICALGTVICRACAEECLAGNEPGGAECAAACLRAAEECHAIAAMSPGPVTVSAR